MDIKLNEKIEQFKGLKKDKKIAIGIGGGLLLLFLISSFFLGYGIDDLKGSWQVDVEKTFEIILDQTLKDSDEKPTPAQISMGVQSLQQQVGEMVMSFSENVVTTSIPPFPPIPMSFEIVSEDGKTLKIRTEKQKEMEIYFFSNNEIMMTEGGKEQGLVYKKID